MPDHAKARVTEAPLTAVEPPADHRTAVGRIRRAKTQARILEAALRVFSEKGPDAPVIDDFIKAAGIARGTFYNYFNSTEELLDATSKWLIDDLIQSIETEIRSIKDPVLRHCTGLRLFMKKAELDRAWCAFVARVWIDIDAQAPMKGIKLGVKSGAFKGPSLESGYDLAMGTMRQAMLRLVKHPQLTDYGDAIARIILQGHGVDRAKIDEVIAHPLPEMRRLPRTVN